MDDNKTILPKRFCELYYALYEYILNDYQRKTKKRLREYKKYEPEYLMEFFKDYKDKKDIINQVSSMGSRLILIQALPNANHRTAFMFIRIYLKKHNLYLKTYDEDKERYDIFYKKSKKILESEINHEELFNKRYVDVQHTAGIEAHQESMDRLLLETIQLPQSGMVTVESFHSFIASLNHAGSLPSSNH